MLDGHSCKSEMASMFFSVHLDLDQTKCLTSLQGEISFCKAQVGIRTLQQLLLLRPGAFSLSETYHLCFFFFPLYSSVIFFGARVDQSVVFLSCVSTPLGKFSAGELQIGAYTCNHLTPNL